jgi:hypothetical protein
MSQPNNGNTYRGAGRSRSILRKYAPSGKNYLFVIGIDEYQHLPKLYNAVMDAKDIIQVLTEQYQFSTERLLTLYNEEATQSAIINKLRYLAETIGEKDTLLIYFSGHGEFDNIIDTGYWIPVDGRRSEIGSYVSFDMITKFIKVIHSHHTFVIADSCYSGSIFTERKAGDVLDHLESLPSRWVLTAGRNEVVSDGQQGMNSPFADAILYRLRNNQEPRLPVSEFCNYIKMDVRNNANQLPRGASLHGVGDRGGEFMFRRKEYAHAVVEEAVPVVEEAEAPRGTGREPDGRPALVEEPAKPKIPETFENVAALKMTLKTLVSSHDFEDVFKVFNRVIDPGASLHDDLILKEGQYNGLMRDKAQGIITPERLNISKNQIMNALLYYINDIEAEDLKAGTIGPAGKEEGATGDIAKDLSAIERESLENQAKLLQRKISFLQEKKNTAAPSQEFSLNVQIEEAQQHLEEIKVKLGLNDGK